MSGGHEYIGTLKSNWTSRSEFKIYLREHGYIIILNLDDIWGINFYYSYQVIPIEISSSKEFMKIDDISG